MLNLRPILFVIGILLAILSAAMVIPAIVDAVLKNPDWGGFALSAFLTAFVGVSLILINLGYQGDISIRQAFFLTTFSWVTVCAFGALPFVFSAVKLSYTDAFFETMSGLTTTGSTVMSGLDHLAPGILLWRSILHGLGGVGIIVMALAILPMLKIGGMQLFRTESSDKSDKILPRATQIAGAIIGIYFLLLFACTTLLWMAGMSLFDAICHALGTISTGGFSTHDASLGYFRSPTIEVIITIFMVLSSIPFLLYIYVLRGNPMALIRDTQVQWFIAIGFFSIATISAWQFFINHVPLYDALRHTIFSVTSIITTTGFVTVDYSTWGNFVITFIFMLTVVGGCTGSTTGGIKIFRYQILYETAKTQIRHLIQPHGVFRPLFNHKVVPEPVTSSVMSFFILFAFCFLAFTVLLSMTGLDYLTSMSATATALGNVGPGLGNIVGPVGNFSTLPDTAKWLLSAAMLIGRLEVFTVLVLFTPYFWRS